MEDGEVNNNKRGEQASTGQNTKCRSEEQTHAPILSDFRVVCAPKESGAEKP